MRNKCFNLKSYEQIVVRMKVKCLNLWYILIQHVWNLYFYYNVCWNSISQTQLWIQWNVYKWLAIFWKSGCWVDIISKQALYQPKLICGQFHIEKHWGCNSFWPSDAIRWHRSESRLAHIMAWCLTAPSHYLNQFWLIVKTFPQYSPEGNFTCNVQDFCPDMSLKTYIFNITDASPRGQWVWGKFHISLYLEALGFNKHNSHPHPSASNSCIRFQLFTTG